MRTLLNKYDYGSANLPTRDSSFLGSLNTFKPSNYPTFTDASVRNPHGDVSYFKVVNTASSLCMDVSGGVMASGSDVIQWTCSGADWQRWSYDPATGAIRSKNDPRYCLDNSSVFTTGADVILWECNGGDAQRFTVDTGGYIHVSVAPDQVVDGHGSAAGDDVGTGASSGGANQRWEWVP